MKKSDELKQKRHTLMGELRNLASSGLNERKIEERENELSAEIHELSGLILKKEIEEKRANEAASSNGFIVKGDNDLDKYSFARAIRVAAGFEKGGIESEMHDEAKREAQNIGQSLKGFGIPSVVLSRASSGQNVAASADGGLLAGTGGMRFFEALKNKLVLTQLGAQFLTGLHGNVPLVGGGTFTASFASEGAEIAKTKMAFADRGTLTPKRLGATGAISKELIHQSSVNVEKIIIDALTSAIAQAIQDAAINGSGIAPVPTGILNTVGVKSVVMGTDGLAPAWKNIVDLETVVKQANGLGSRMGYLTNSLVIGKMKTTVRGGLDKFIMEDAQLNGYNCFDTNAVPNNLVKGGSGAVCSALIFGAWESLLIGQWGGLDLIVDPYSRKNFGEIELNTTQFIDIGISNPDHFGVCKDILTT